MQANATTQAPGSQPTSMLTNAQDPAIFGGLWVDGQNVDREISNKTKGETTDTASYLQEYVERGYTIFRGVIAPELVDRVVNDTLDIFNHGERYVAKKGGRYIDPLKMKKDDPEARSHRISDIYGISANARDAIYPPIVAEFLGLVFGEPAIAMQSISFEYGSQQAIHQDTAYVVSNKPRSLAATWLALEDVEEGTGELIYYPGSHRFDHFLFSGSHKEWAVNRDGEEQHKEFLKQLHSQAEARGLKIEHFLPRKGDILVWHADLAHGGAKITKPNRTRRSLVTHFCPQSVKPRYHTSMGDKYFEYEYGPESFFTTKHYDLRDLKRGTLPKIVFDGGVSENRKK
jgi:ectoine hydroxylase-related dioxygenase (phytanoyl-CoA dioxygenase family)